MEPIVDAIRFIDQLRHDPGALSLQSHCRSTAPTKCISAIRTDGLGLAMMLGALM
jgi:hypothetical protein